MGIARTKTARVISVGSGKGGVGKSVVAVNLSVAMAQAGARTVIVDADLGAANVHSLFGIDRPGQTLQALIERDVDTLEAVTVPTGVAGLRMVPGRVASVGDANIDHARKLKLIRHIRALDADVVIVDVGAGVSFNTLDLFNAGDLRLVVVTPELTSVQNAYALLKGSIFRELRALAGDSVHARMVDDSPEATLAAERLPRLLERIAEDDPALAARFCAAVAGYRGWLVGNQVSDNRELGVLHAVCRMAQDFLGLQLKVLGALRASRRIKDSVVARRPYLLDGGGEPSVATLHAMAQALLEEDAEDSRRQRALTQAVAAHAPRRVEGPAPDMPLPAGLEQYVRSSERHPVHCPAVLVHQGRAVPAWLLDVSEGGALVQVEAPPVVDATVQLVLTGLPGRLALACRVRHSSVELGSAGVEFSDRALGRRAAAELFRRWQPAPAAAVGT